MTSECRERARSGLAPRSSGVRLWPAAVVAALALTAIAAGCGRKPATAASDETDRPADDWGPGRNTIVPVVPIFGPDLDPRLPGWPDRTADPRDEPSKRPSDTCHDGSDPRRRPVVDVIVSIGGFGSAAREIPWISKELSNMAVFLGGSGIDARFVLVGGPDLCVYPPLGGPECRDSRRYRHIPRWSKAEEALPQLLEEYPKYADELRADSYRVIIALADDTPEAHEPPDPPPPPADGPATPIDKELLALLEGTAGNAGFFGLVTLTYLPTDLSASCAKLGPDPSFRQLEQATGGMTEVHCGRERKVWVDFFQTVSESVRSETSERSRLLEGCERDAGPGR